MAKIVFLALLGSFFTPLAVDASIQIWSGTITVGVSGDSRGYFGRNLRFAVAPFGTISDADFVHNGTTYRIGFITTRGGSYPDPRYDLYLAIDSAVAISGCDLRHWTLYVEGFTEGYTLSDAEYYDGWSLSSLSSYRWGFLGADRKPSWSANDRIDLRLTYAALLTPDAPIVTAFNEGNQVQLFWTTTCDGGADITGYEYREKVGNGAFGSWEPIPNSAAGEVNATSYTVTTLNDPSEYTFEIQAVNALGEGEISAEAVVSNQPAVPLSDRTPQVRDAIVDAVPGISDYLSVTEAHLAAITILRLGYQNITALRPGDFSGLTALTRLNLPGNQLSSLPDSLFEGLTALTQLRLGSNSVNPLPLTVSLEKVGTDQFKAVTPSGAPFEIVLPLSVANGSISGGATTITVPAGSLESQPLTVTRTPGTTFAVTVDISSLPRLPPNHYGYTLVKSDNLPITVTEGDIPGTSVLTLTVGENPNDPFNDYPFGRIGYNQYPSLPDWNFGTLSSPAFVINGVFYTVTSLYYLTYSKQLTLRTSPALPRGFVLYLGSQQFNSVGSYGGSYWENVNLNWSVGQTVQVRIVETTPILLGPPTNLQATTQNENIMLAWELPANSDPTTLPVNEYEIRISTDGGTTWEDGWGRLYDSYLGGENRNGITIGSNRADVYRILSNGTEYTFEVRALGGDGFGDAASVTLVFDGITGITPLGLRSREVREAIVAAVPGISDYRNVTRAHLATIRSLSFQSQYIGTLRTGDFDGLTALAHLNLAQTQLYWIPADLFEGLSSLTTLYLNDNQLSGAIPLELGSLANLQSLNLGHNQLSGPIPPELENLDNLQSLDLSRNQLSGAIPPELGNLDNLQELILSDNQLSGPIPPELGNLANLQTLTLDSNQLSGAIPPELENLDNLQELILSDNQLSGAIPPELGNLDNLQELILSDNQLSGPIPPELGNLDNLQELWLNNNQLSGCIPEGLRNVLSSYNNSSQRSLSFCDEGDRAALVALYQATNGDNWTNNTNWLSAKPIGEWHGVTTDANGRVTTLALINNQLSGSIPAALGNLSNLTTLRLSQNQLSGAIPAELGNLANLEVLWLHSNQLSGMIPSALGNLANLTTLVLRGNQLSGRIPAELANLSNLTTLFLSGNQLSGCVPDGLQGVLRDFLQLDLPFCGAAVSASPDSLALVALYNATDGDNWTNNTNWLSAKPIGEWHGITTNANGRVTQLNLSQNQLSGVIPSELANLANLTILRLFSNQLSGAIPPQLGSLSNLKWLLLRQNELSGAIPASLGNLANLTILDLSDNQLSGAIPAELGNLANLTQLGLADNQLSGAIPAELANLSNLITLLLSENELSGAIPPQLGNLSNLTQLDLADNQLSGAIPAELANLSNLITLLLSENELSGAIPPQLGNLANLQYLRLYSNQLSGAIPAELGSLANLQELHLSENELSGAIPPQLGNLANLKWLLLRQNELSGAIPAELANLANLQYLWLGGTQLCVPTDAAFQAWLSGIGSKSGVVNCGLGDAAVSASPDSLVLVALYNATDGDNWTNNANWLSDKPIGEWHGVITNANGRVTTLDLSQNQLSGTIPAELGNLANLTTLGLTDNQLSGTIPAELGNLANLTDLFLNSNQLSGPIPPELGTLSNLTWLALSQNQLSGSILSALGTLSNLTRLDLRENELNGVIPSELGNLANLTMLGLSDNQLSGTIPPQLGSLSNLEWLLLRQNELSGSIPASFGNLANLTILHLSDNQLSGAIPAELANLSNLTQLGLADNQLSGAIPAQLGSLANLQSLYLNNNQLSGAIPAELANLANLRGLHLYSNQLSGSVPAELENLANLRELWLEDTQLCVPTDAAFQAWLSGIGSKSGVVNCGLGDAAVSASPDSLALVALYNATDGDNWTNNANWLSAKPIGEWHGVTTNQAGRVTNLTLLGNNLVGTIPAELANLANLRYLSLENNQLSGTIPAELANLDNLQRLNLRSNQLSGAIPAELANLDNLQRLNLRSNQLSGTIPAELANLDNLQRLNLRSNQLSGTIPAELANLDNLQYLWLSDNQLSGCIPEGLRNVSSNDLPQLGLFFCGEAASPDRAALVALYNATDGDNWTNNTHWLSDTPIGQWYGITTDEARRVTHLTLASNNLVGTIPAELGNLANLQNLVLDDNQLSGTIPPSFTSLALDVLRFDNGPAGLCAPTEAAFQAWLQGISDRDGGPNCLELLTVTAIPSVVREDAGPTEIELTVELANSLNEDEAVVFTIVDESAVRDVDYTASIGSLMIPAGSVRGSTTLTVTPINDTRSNDPKVFAVKAIVGGIEATTDIAIDDDEAPSTSIALTVAPAEIREDAGATEVRVTAALDGNVLGEDVTLTLVLAPAGTATRDSDYTAVLGRLVIVADRIQGSTAVSITPVDDGEAEPDETIIVQVASNPTNQDGDPLAVGTATITLKDTGEHVEPPPPSDTTPTFAGTVADLSATVGAPIAPVVLPAATGNDPMTYAVSTLPAGLSFDPATRTLSGTPTAAGTTSVTYTVIDGDAESPESAAQTFTIAVTETPASTVEIADLVSTPASLREDAGATAITLTATLTAASAADATIRFALVAPTTGPAAIRDTDYTATLAAVVPLAAGATEATTTLRLAPIDNNEADGDRSLGVEASIAGSSAQIDIAITDDEGPSTSIALSVNPAEISEQDGRVNVEVTAALDGAPLSENAIVTLSIDPASTASRDIDYSVVFDPQIQIPSGSTMGSTQLEIQPVADSEDEGNETIKLIGAINGLMGDEAEITLSEQAVPPEEETDDSPLAFADDTALADQEYTAATPIDPLVLPEASGGTGQLTYSVSTLPAGLVFDPATRTISGTPTAATDGAVTVAYTATDEAGTAVVLTFSITVNAGLSFGDLFDSFGAGKIVPTASHD